MAMMTMTAPRMISTDAMREVDAGSGHGGSSLKSGAHGSLRKQGVLLCVSPRAMTFDVFVTR